MSDSNIQAALASQHRISLIAVVRHARKLSMKEIVEQLEDDDKDFVMSQPLEVFASEVDAAADTVTDGPVAEVAPRKRAQRSVKRKAAAAKETKAPKAKAGKKAPKKAPPRPAATAKSNGANGHAKPTAASSADALVAGFIAKAGKGAEFKMGDLLKASGDKISRVTLINALSKVGKAITRQGSGRGTSYVVN